MGHFPLPAQHPSMEVTTVSPSPASPTEGDDLCEIDATSVAIHSVTLLIGLCGLAGNGAVLWLLRVIRRNSGIFKLAVADFIFLLLTVFSTLLFLVEDMSCSYIMPVLYLSFFFQLSVVSYYWALFRLMPSSTLQSMQKLCRIGCRRDLSLRLRWLVDSVQYWAFFALFTVIPAVTLLCPSNEQEHCRVPLITMSAIILFLFVVPVFISRTVDFIKAKWGSQKKQPKRRDIVIIITALFTLLLSLWNFLQQLGYFAVSPQIFFLLTCIHSSIKPLMYFLVGSCWRTGYSMMISWKHSTVGSFRDSLHRVFDE